MRLICKGLLVNLRDEAFGTTVNKRDCQSIHLLEQVRTSGIATCPRTADVSDAKFAAQRTALAASTRKLSS